ncbi:MAG: hypothetical protein DRI39_06810 [Chloroflexi bacterium]|nr:MAG: hypothetical protein DRI39_06810 [Chloroflexota bacterium]RLC95826.1 MAG: hypothetical protein DRI40_04840 [Chloroflexota bacterium]
MKVYDRLLVCLALVFALTTVLISTSNQGLDVYFSVYLFECLALTLLFSHLNPSARAGLNRVSYVLAIGLLCLVALRVTEVVTGVEII